MTPGLYHVHGVWCTGTHLSSLDNAHRPPAPTDRTRDFDRSPTPLTPYNSLGIRVQESEYHTLDR